MFLYLLGSISTALTIAMFATRQMMLGFPSAIFWAIFGGYCYTLSATTWDTYYLLFFASMGMAIFSMFAMYALRTRKEDALEGDSLIDEAPAKERERFIGDSPIERRNLRPSANRRPTHIRTRSWKL